MDYLSLIDTVIENKTINMTTSTAPRGNNFSRSEGSSSSRGPRPSGQGSFNNSSSRSRFGGGGNSGGYRGGNSGGSSRGGFSSGGSRGGFSGGRSSFGGNKRRSFKGDNIDETRFVNRASEIEEVAHVAKHTFADFGVHEMLAKNLAAKGYVQPSPIQDQAIPVALEGGDVIGIANTGTGKTAAFLIPIINKLVSDKNSKVMVLTPTRELAQQIEAEFRSMTVGMRLWSVSTVGGLPIMRQIRSLEMGVHIVIGTPGRVKDLIARNKINMAQISTIVLDEADRMMDMGFIDDMRMILGGMPKDRQSLFFSATFSPEIRNLCNDFLNNPTTIAIKTRDTSSSVDQDIIRSHPADRVEKLHDLLTQPEFTKVLIFRETKHHTDELARELKDRGFAVSALHGDMRSRERSRAVEALTKGQIQAVIATDVAARGIDIPDISHVINFDTPSTYDTYVHRIGRTGRGNKKGIALTFVR